MVLNCAYPGCLNLYKKMRLRAHSLTRGSKLTFHRFPIFDPDRLMLWLLALRKDIDTPMRSLAVWRVCSEHFTTEDFKQIKGNKVLLKSTAVPMVYSPLAEDSHNDAPQPQQHNKEECKEEETEFLVSDALEDPPQSIPQSTSQLFHNYALLPVWPYHSDQPVHCDEPSQGRIDLNIIMLSLDQPSDKKDVSLTPATHAPTTKEEEEEELKWNDRKCLVNESSVMELFRRCQQCGALIVDTRTVTSSSLVRVDWECEQRHKGQWNSCPDSCEPLLEQPAP